MRKKLMGNWAVIIAIVVILFSGGIGTQIVDGNGLPFFLVAPLCVAFYMNSWMVINAIIHRNNRRLSQIKYAVIPVVWWVVAVGFFFTPDKFNGTITGYIWIGIVDLVAIISIVNALIYEKKVKKLDKKDGT